MSSSFGSSSDGEVELNLAPIVDCFTVLIAYMLASASMISLGILEVGVAASGESNVAVEVPTDPPLAMSVTVALPVPGQLKKVDIKVTGGKENFDESYFVAAKADGTWDQDAIKAKVSEILGKHAKLDEANVNADQDVEYKEIIQVIQALKANIKKVYLAG